MKTLHFSELMLAGAFVLLTALFIFPKSDNHACVMLESAGYSTHIKNTDRMALNDES